MATLDHTPRGRGYDSSFGYFHHDNDYWTERLWARYSDNGTVKQCGSAVYVDLWLAEVGTAGKGAVGMNGSKPEHSNEHCQQIDDGEECRIPFGVNGSVPAYEEWRFAQRAVRLIAEHDSSIPFFLNYDLHIAHEPIELPRVYFDRQQGLVNASGVADYDHRRTTYQGMVGFMDEVIGNITAALHTKQMYDQTILVYSSDNGGPSWTASHHLAASNWPLRGSKDTDLEGGVRVGAFISGGFVQTHAQANVGRSLGGIVHIADWFSTLCALAGVSPVDGRAARAGLPSVVSQMTFFFFFFTFPNELTRQNLGCIRKTERIKQCRFA
jgi:arylsulfatase I/J